MKNNDRTKNQVEDGVMVLGNKTYKITELDRPKEGNETQQNQNESRSILELFEISQDISAAMGRAVDEREDLRKIEKIVDADSDAGREVQFRIGMLGKIITHYLSCGIFADDRETDVFLMVSGRETDTFLTLHNDRCWRYIPVIPEVSMTADEAVAARVEIEPPLTSFPNTEVSHENF